MTDMSSHAHTPRYYSVKDAARILGVSPMTIYRSIDDGSLRAVRARRRLLIPRSALEALE